MSNILVIGGTGKTGRRVVEKLKNHDVNVRVGARSATIPFDWENRDTWPAVLENIDKAYVTYSPDLAIPGALDKIEALVKLAKKQGLKKMILLSGKGEKEAQLCEQVLIHSGLDYTIVRASWFMQNFSESFFLDALQVGQVALPKPEAKVPYVNADDIAAVVVEALLDDKHNGQLYELTGSRLLTFEDVVNEINLTTGREIQFTAIPHEEYIAMLKEFNVPAEYIWLIDYLFTNVLDAEGNNEISNDIENVLGRKPIDFSDFVKETAKTGVWDGVEVNK
ncbi:NmrA family NAD(P)-binding protein [Wenyingzhuangia sp. IMCC45574]